MTFDESDYETLPTNNVVTHMTAGAIAGIMEHCVMYPLDSVKTRMQSLVGSTGDGIVTTFSRMVREEGLMRPVRGMSAMVIGAGPSHALYFSSYEYLKTKLGSLTTNPNYQTLSCGAAGCIATLLHDGFMNPAEVVKQRMQMINSPFHSMLRCCSHIYRNEGFRAFYRSYSTQLTMNIPFQSIHFMVYDVAQQITNRERTYNPPAHMVSGALAGAIAAAVTTPLDVCKTLLNTQQVGGTTGMVEAFRTVYRIGGVAGYFKGMQARILYQMPATAICWSTYEFFKYLLMRSPEVRLGPTTVLANNESGKEKTIDVIASAAEKQQEKRETEKPLLKPRELPAMSGAGIYGSISFNTMHTADSSFSSNNGRRKESVFDIIHT